MKTNVRAGAGAATATQAWEAIALERPLPLDSVATPALAVDADALERNLRRMAAHAKRKTSRCGRTPRRTSVRCSPRGSSSSARSACVPPR